MTTPETPSPMGALEKARDTFRHYGDLHAAKPDMDKAGRNYALAVEMQEAIDALIETKP